jgi:uncharacterized damage-inducible protein DinB
MAFLNEFDHEMRQTRKLLERVPDDRLEFRPHPRSKTLGALALHVAGIPSWTSNLLGEASYDLGPDLATRERERALPKDNAEILATFDASVAKARAHIEAQSEGDLKKKWSLRKGAETVVTLPRAAVLRQFLMNHLVHHRGQLTVYLRMLDVPVPALYGPSADED